MTYRFQDNLLNTLQYYWDFDAQHACRVERLACRLFDQLQPLHHMGATERIWLSFAALLHDIAKSTNPKRHHKAAQQVILEDLDLPLPAHGRLMVALIARYHRGQLPHPRHEDYRSLDKDAREYVRKCAALLRLADGLDKGGRGLVAEVFCRLSARKTHLIVLATQKQSLAKLRRKAPLFETVFQNRLTASLEVVSPAGNLSGPSNPFARITESVRWPSIYS
ncbi:HD domain-containing protein [Planctomycetota bacterium]